MEKENISIKIFDKQFKVELISFEDKSTKEKTYRKVIFRADGEVYHYIYEGKLSFVVKDTGEEVYSPFKRIENGTYYEEIGRKLSIQQRATDINKVFGKMPSARELLEEKENNLFSGYSEKTKEIFQNHISLESEEGYLLIKAQDVLDAIEEALSQQPTRPTEAEELLLDCFAQACETEDGFDHMHLSTYEYTQRYLIEKKLIDSKNCKR